MTDQYAAPWQGFNTGDLHKTNNGNMEGLITWHKEKKTDFPFEAKPS